MTGVGFPASVNSVSTARRWKGATIVTREHTVVCCIWQKSGTQTPIFDTNGIYALLQALVS